MNSEGLGSIERRAEQTTLRYTRLLQHPPDEIWRVLTDSEHLRSWLPIDVIGTRAANENVEFRFWPDVAAKHHLDPDAGHGSIRVWDPPTTFEWTWNDSIIRFEIHDDKTGSELTLNVDIRATALDAIIDNAAGYHLWMDHITRLLDTGHSPSIAHADPAPIEHQYRQSLNPGQP